MFLYRKCHLDLFKCAKHADRQQFVVENFIIESSFKTGRHSAFSALCKMLADSNTSNIMLPPTLDGFYFASVVSFTYYILVYFSSVFAHVPLSHHHSLFTAQMPLQPALARRWELSHSWKPSQKQQPQTAIGWSVEYLALCRHHSDHFFPQTTMRHLRTKPQEIENISNDLHVSIYLSIYLLTQNLRYLKKFEEVV